MLPIHVALNLLVVMAWGINFVALKIALTDIPPLLLAAERFFLASIPIIFFIKKPAIPFRLVIRYGIMMFTIPFALLLCGMYAGVSAGIAALLHQLQGPFTILLGVIILKEQIHKWQIIGIGCAGLGLMLIGFNTGGSVTLPGLMLIVLAACTTSIGNLSSKKTGNVNMLSLVAWSSFVAWPPLLLISFLFEGYDKIAHSFTVLSTPAIAATCYVAYVSTLFCFATWSFLLHKYPFSTVIPFSLLVPIISLSGSAIMLQESLPWWKILALILVGSGVAINIFTARYKNKKLLGKLND